MTPLLSDSSQVSNRIRRNYSIHISLDREVSSMKSGAQLIAAILAAGLGVITVVTGHIGSGTVREMQANGVAARFVGVLLFIMRR
jgi:hypothetical protein